MNQQELSINQKQPQPSEFILSTLSTFKGLYDLGFSEEAVSFSFFLSFFFLFSKNELH